MPPSIPKDAAPSYLGDLVRLLIRFFMEEAREPEHQGPDEGGAKDGPPPKIAAGIIFRAPDGSALLLKRSPDDANFAGHWSLPGGGADPGETAEQAATRESLEEIGREPPGPLRLLSRQETPTGMVFHTFECPVPETFEPTLNGEHTDFVWARPDALPDPMHPKVRATLTGGGAADSVTTDRLAMDRDTVRQKDEDGRLKVERANISKAVVNPYLGREIPGWEALGLKPDRTYRLLRHPDELARAAPTFNALPLLDTHVPSTAWDHPFGKVVGTTGTDAAFEAPYLTNSLAVWTADAIAGIEDGTQKELSCGYRYDPDMTPGTYEGQPYDGVMRNLKGNHVALVKEGRAGPDVVVGDAKPLEIESENMSKRKGIVAKLRGVLMGKMAQDAMGEAEGLLAELEAGDEAETVTPAARKTKAEILAALAGKLGEEDMAALGAMLGEDESHEVSEVDTGKSSVPVPKVTVGDQPAPFQGQPEPPVTKAAMDAALAAERTKTEAAVIARMNAVAEARDLVRPVVGNLAVACDSSEGVFKAALEMRGVNLKDVHPSAYRAMWDMHVQAATPRRAPVQAMDSASAKGFADRFPGAGRIGTA